MKSLKKTQLALIVATALLFTSCATTSLNINVLQPAQINLPQSIQKIGIVNRSLPSKDSKWNNILEGALTGESIKVDKMGSESCIKTLAEKLNEAPRFSAVTIYGLSLGGTGTGSFPLPLDKDQVSSICRQYEVDALVVLETFDSDIALRQGSRMVERTINDRKVMVKEFFAETNIDVNSGWRIYDGTKLVIVDENAFTDGKSYSGAGDTPEKALGQLPDKKSAITDAAINSGAQYARRISPTWKAVSRQYYSKGHPELELAAKSVKKNNWDPAIEIWNRLSQDPDNEVAGRACYNMAVASEMDGNLDIALTWAEKSSVQHNNKKATEYIKIIKSRQWDVRLLEHQMKNQE